MDTGAGGFGPPSPFGRAADVAATSWEKADNLEKDGGDGRGEGHIEHQQRENHILKRRQDDDDRLTKRARHRALGKKRPADRPKTGPPHRDRRNMRMLRSVCSSVSDKTQFFCEMEEIASSKGPKSAIWTQTGSETQARTLGAS